MDPTWIRAPELDPTWIRALELDPTWIRALELDYLGAAGRHWVMAMKESLDFRRWKLNKRNRSIFGAESCWELPGVSWSIHPGSPGSIWEVLVGIGPSL